MAQGQPAINAAEREAFFAKLRERILRLATYLGCGEDSAEIAQDTMLELAQSYRSIKPQEDLIKIANRICVNKVMNLRRRRQRWGMMPLDERQQLSLGPNAETLAMSQESRESFYAALRRCCRRCKKLFLLDLEEADTERMCRELKLSAAALYTLRNRCSAKLRDLLVEH